MAKLPRQQQHAAPAPSYPPDSADFAEAPTEKRSIPDQLREPEPPPPVYVTTKLRKVEIDALLARERTVKPSIGSGLRPALASDAIERHERRARETLPAPASDDAGAAAADDEGEGERGDDGVDGG